MATIAPGRTARQRKRASVLPGVVVDKHVIDMLSATTIPLSAYELLSGIRRSFALGTPMTVYRALDRLCSKGLIERVETLSAYRLRDLPAALLLTCRACGSTRPRQVLEERGRLEKQAKEAGFLLERLAIEGVGLCSRCRADAKV